MKKLILFGLVLLLVGAVYGATLTCTPDPLVLGGTETCVTSSLSGGEANGKIEWYNPSNQKVYTSNCGSGVCTSTYNPSILGTWKVKYTKGGSPEDTFSVVQCTSGDCCDTSTGSFRLNTYVCRPANGVCDVEEKCTGNSADCPTDSFRPNTYVCRQEHEGGCDVEEKCTGNSPTCPADAVKPAGTECRAAFGNCDIADVCNGVSNVCPADSYENPRACYSGDPNLIGVGVCRSGTQTCSVSAPHNWGSCVGEVLPGTEACNGLDDDCDGSTDEGLSESYYTGPEGTSGVGLCSAGLKDCVDGQMQVVTPEVTPAQEVCGNGIDEDCDGSDLECQIPEFTYLGALVGLLGVAGLFVVMRKR